ncbi:extracellular matrix protein A-like isoform X2 [Heterodontus francisci]|uniref:extracellular matrix protein A-like isoform X2 n=1 Tax=Heterodontus francisci TaxID=7792 RepID=UPI00355B462C
MGKVCEGERDCGRWQTCCQTPCGARCVFKIFRDEDGKCLQPALLARVCNCTFGKVCESDGDCDASQTCCDAGCQKRCVPSFYGKSSGGSSWSTKRDSLTDTKSKQCPSASNLQRVCNTKHSEPCEDDDDCGSWKQCCKAPCGNRCVHAFMGQSRSTAFSDRTADECPAPHRLSMMCELKYGELCDDDDDCYAWQTCCNTTCGRRCVHALRHKGGEGRCPEASRMSHVCTMSFNTQCHNDSSCESWQSCCNASCGNRCVPRFITRSTQCPASSRLDAFCSMKLGDKCESDADCLAWSSCCDAGCGKRCVPRFFMAKDNTCPAPHRLSPMCDLKLGGQCTGDDDCDAWQTCCDTKCGKICIASFMDNDEDDECPTSYRARRICGKNSSEPCNSDEDCGSWKQCCDIGCGKRCVHSWNKKTQQCPSSSTLKKVCSMKLGDECEEDGDCDNWQMCCDAGCGKRCVFKFHKGENDTCPAPSRLGPMCDINYGKECDDDDDCDMWLTCCDAGCGKRCVHQSYRHKKRDKECPEPSTTQHVCDKEQAETCQTDEDCTGWKQCCRVGDCGKRCVYVFNKRSESKTWKTHKREEDFKCPASNRLTPLCQMKLGNRCTSDDDCDIWQTCCKTGCGDRCVMNFNSRGLGKTCPDPSRVHYVCMMNFTAPCTDDSCGDWASCCNTECGPRCVPECIAKKSGDQCASENRLSMFCHVTTGESCDGNKDCDAYHTCCDAGCGKKCIPKMFSKGNGTCPLHSRLTMMCDMKMGDDCRHDTECDIWQTCCKTTCGKKCVPSFFSKFKPKKCPEVSKVTQLCKKTYIKSCEDDDDCSAHKQCCDIGCGKKCVHSFTQGDKPGECASPSKLSYVCNSTMGKVCEGERDCGRWQTCCQTPCGARCVFKIFRDEDGKCLQPALLARVCNCTFGKVCESDGDCDASQTCCDAGCQKRCVPSFYGKSSGGSSWSTKRDSLTDTKSKQCPSASNLQRVCNTKHSEPCEDDDDCGSWKQCCKAPCGNRCVHAFMGQSRSTAFSDRTADECPAPHRLSMMCELKYGELCDDDDDCYAWQTCCNTTCGRRCVHALRHKGGEGRCPEASRMSHVCTMSFNTQCHNDSSCESWQSCCNASCGNRCVPRFITRSTQCPASSRLDAFCSMKLGDKCESDADCLAWSSCCDAGCGKRCVPRFFMAKDNTCPAPHRLSPMCDLKLGGQCTGDDDCDAWQTCCDTKCGKICIASFMDNDEDDECPTSYRARRICGKNSSEPCNSDEDCGSWKQCCDIGCGKRCVHSWNKKTQQCPSSSSLKKVCSMKLGDECEEDGDCDNWQMCCDAGCGKRCVFKFHKGENDTCPAPSRLGPMCDINYGKECDDDDDCDMWLTCCDAGCGKRCVHQSYRHKKRDKECPEPSTTQHVCDKEQAETCQTDEDCTGWKQCCRVGDCGKRCVYVFNKRSESKTWKTHKREEDFKCPAANRLTPLCQMKLGNRCTSDDDCDIWQTCCKTGCGDRCVMNFNSRGLGKTCPDPSRVHYVCMMNFTAPCTDDSCGDWASCCNTECGPRCVPECIAKKSGDQCASENRLSMFCHITTGESCDGNKDCDAYHTCCDAGCGKKCIPKMFSKGNGTCPLHSRLTMMCDMKMGDDCRHDTECDIWQTCCKTTCGKKCVPSFFSKFKPKKCPEVSKVTQLCKKTYIKSCEDDDDCSAHKQCCDIGCGKKCVHSFTQGDKPGECASPSKLSYVCNSTMGKVCEGERDCGRWQTCCQTPCGARCVFKIFRDEDGKCLQPALLARVCNCTFGKVCESDGDCDASQTCCDAGCQKRCVPSFYGKSSGGSSWSTKRDSLTDTKSKQCPSASNLQRVCNTKHSEPCEDDDDCGSWKQCCKAPCGNRCVHAFMGQSRSTAFSDRTADECPAPHRLSMMCELKYGELCDDDDDCYAWQTCCNTTCGRRCVHALRHKGGEGRCPEASRMSHVCTMSFNTQCHNDSSCESWQSCCNASCGNRCVPRFITRSTQCPASSRLDAFCSMKLGDKCESDADCLAWSSCCDAGCGKRCVPRFFMAKDNTCPAPHRLSPMCDLKLGGQCTGDDDCDAWQTCCDTKCGKICIASFMDNDEDDECPTSYRARRICGKNSSEPCNSDEDCGSWKQCCDIGCGKRCVHSWNKKTQQCPSSSSLKKVCSMKLGDECEEDGDCDNWQMCCDAGCGKRCVFKFHKGENDTCPAPSRLGPMCDINYGKECDDDDDCDMWLTCCDAGCGKRCVHQSYRHKKRDKECPEPSTTQHVCDKEQAETCQTDEDCTGWKQCCRVGDCGKRCVYVFNKRSESKTWKTHKRESCRSDSDCDRHLTCCRRLCQRSCSDNGEPSAQSSNGHSEEKDYEWEEYSDDGEWEEYGDDGETMEDGDEGERDEEDGDLLEDSDDDEGIEDRDSDELLQGGDNDEGEEDGEEDKVEVTGLRGCSRGGKSSQGSMNSNTAKWQDKDPGGKRPEKSGRYQSPRRKKPTKRQGGKRLKKSGQYKRRSSKAPKKSNGDQRQGGKRLKNSDYDQAKQGRGKNLKQSKEKGLRKKTRKPKGKKAHQANWKRKGKRTRAGKSWKAKPKRQQ